MAKLNLNLMLSNVAVNAVVVAMRMGQGSKLGTKQAPVTLSLGWPVHTGPEPKPATRNALRLDLIERDRLRERAGRSAVSPLAGGVVSCPACSFRPAPALGASTQLAYMPDFMFGMFASDMQATSAR